MDTITTSSELKFDFELVRGDETTTRRISISDPELSQEGEQAAIKFAKIFYGGASSPFSVIDPTKFVQPAGWRDDNDAEEEWTTTNVNIYYVNQTVTKVDKGDSPSSGKPVPVITLTPPTLTRSQI